MPSVLASDHFPVVKRHGLSLFTIKIGPKMKCQQRMRFPEPVACLLFSIPFTNRFESFCFWRYVLVRKVVISVEKYHPGMD